MSRLRESVCCWYSVCTLPQHVHEEPEEYGSTYGGQSPLRAVQGLDYSKLLPCILSAPLLPPSLFQLLIMLAVPLIKYKPVQPHNVLPRRNEVKTNATIHERTHKGTHNLIYYCGGIGSKNNLTISFI